MSDFSHDNLWRRIARRLDHLLLGACSRLDAWDRRRDAVGADRQLTDEARETFEVGAVIARRYRLENVLGRGGMGRVWLAHDSRHDRSVVLKEIRTLSASLQARASEELEIAFKREYHTMSKLQHPNTVQVFDSGKSSTGVRFIVMEYIEGEDLSRRLADRPLSAEKTTVF